MARKGQGAQPRRWWNILSERPLAPFTEAKLKAVYSIGLPSPFPSYTVLDESHR